MGQGGVGGEKLEERYFLQKVKLGQGSFGTVWRAVDRSNNETVAIKQLDKASLPRRGVKRQDIEREIAMMKACVHTNITQLFGTFEDANSIYLALEYCDGGDFGDKVKEKGMGIQEPEVAEWMRQICAAIAAMHAKGICHRDIKPDNFMVSGSGSSTLQLKLSDFGLAIYLPPGKLLSEKCGTPAFMSPEQHTIPRSRGYGLPCDIWAAGVSMYMVMFGGRHPFLGEKMQLDDRMLLQGVLDFRETGQPQIFGFRLPGGGALRFSDDCRHLCSRMVEVEPAGRISAQDCLRIPWINQAAPPAIERTRSSPVPPPSGATSRERQPSPDLGRHNTGPEPAHARQERRHSTDQQPWWPGGPRGTGAPAPSARDAQVVGASSAPFPAVKAFQPPNTEVRLLRAENQRLQDQVRVQQEEQSRIEKEKQMMQQQQQQLKNEAQKLQEQKAKQWQQQQQQQWVHQDASEDYSRQRAKYGPDGQILPPGGDAGVSGIRMHRLGETTGASGQQTLPHGTKCRYYSERWGWNPAVVKCFNSDDCTYDLDIRQHAALERIAPPKGPGVEPWQPGATAAYYSSKACTWLPTVVRSFNDVDGSYNLCVREQADSDRIRARVNDTLPTGPPVPALSAAQPGASVAPDRGAGDDANGSSGHGRMPDLRSQPGVRDGSDKAPLRIQDLTGDAKSGPTDGAIPAALQTSQVRLAEGARCILPEGTAVVEGFNKSDGTYIVSMLQSPEIQRTVQAEMMRAPGDSKLAWQPGTKVRYESASLSQWIPAVVVSFNEREGKYNLDVREGAAPEKVCAR